MSSFAIGLVLVSACLHASWNLLARRRGGELTFFIRMLTLIAIIGIVPVFFSELTVRSLPPQAWLCLAGSGVCGAVYLYGLGRAYGAADFTIVYPVARALPVLLVGLGDALRGRLLPLPVWAGLTLVALGCLLSPLRSFREFSLHRYINRSIPWMIMAAAGTVGYSLFDKVASEVVLAGPATAARYCYVFFTFSWLILLLMRRVLGGGSKPGNPGWKTPLIGAVFFFGSYWLILWAYQLGQHASYVLAFRQFSIIIGVVIAFWIYKERGWAVRTVAAALITLGLICVGVFGKG